MDTYWELRGLKTQDVEEKDWFEVEVTLTKSDFVDDDEGWEVIKTLRDPGDPPAETSSWMRSVR